MRYELVIRASNTKLGYYNSMEEAENNAIRIVNAVNVAFAGILSFESVEYIKIIEVSK